MSQVCQDSLWLFFSTGLPNSNGAEFAQPPSAAHTCATTSARAIGIWLTAATEKTAAADPTVAWRR